MTGRVKHANLKGIQQLSQGHLSSIVDVSAKKSIQVLGERVLFWFEYYNRMSKHPNDFACFSVAA